MNETSKALLAQRERIVKALRENARQCEHAMGTPLAITKSEILTMKGAVAALLAFADEIERWETFP